MVEFNFKVIPEFDGSTVVAWVKNVELICRLNGVKRVELVMPLQLASDAFDVYQQMKKEKGDPARIKAVLFKAFTLPSSKAYEQFTAQKLSFKSVACLHGTIAEAGMISWRTARESNAVCIPGCALTTG